MNVNVETVKKFILTLEKNKVEYVVVGGFALDGKRKAITHDHDDVDVYALKKEEARLEKIIKALGLILTNRYFDLYKLKAADGTKIDLYLLEEDGDNLIASGRTHETVFPKEVFFFKAKGKVNDFEFNIGRDELLKKLAADSQYEEDLDFVEKFKVNDKIYGHIRRIAR